MGTQLYERGILFSVNYEELNLSRPEVVRKVHERLRACRGRGHRDQHLRRQRASASRATARRTRCATSTWPRSRSRAEAAAEQGLRGGRHRPDRAHLRRRRGRRRARASRLQRAGRGAGRGRGRCPRDRDHAPARRRSCSRSRRCARWWGPRSPIVAQVSSTKTWPWPTAPRSSRWARRLKARGVDAIGVNCSTGPKTCSRRSRSWSRSVCR